jgi:hypothetical protein
MVALALLWGGACSRGSAAGRDGPPAAPSSSVGTEPSADGTTVETTSATSPPWVGPLDCGRFDLAGGWPTTVTMSPLLGRCLSKAFASGASALLVVSEQTDGDGGAPVVTTYLVVGAHRVLVKVDASAAVGRPADVTVSVCERFDGSVVPPKASRCTPQT